MRGAPVDLPLTSLLRLTGAVSVGGSDRDATSQKLRDAAVAELLGHGQAAFTMEGVAKRGFYSIGTVYNRWPDRDAVLVDIGTEIILPSIVAHITSQPGPAEALQWVLETGREQLLLAGELILAGHTSPAVRPVSLEVWEALQTSLAQQVPAGMAWYVATYAVGSALLGAIGVHGPDPATGRTQWLMDACHSGGGTPPAEAAAALPGDVEIPVVPSPTRSDEVAVALIGAAQVLLQEHGVAGTTTRDIAASAGVTTGALYRRYQGKSRLLADVLLAQLQPDRYTWTWDLVRALASEAPFSQAAGVMAQRMVDVAGDLPAQRVLLQVGIAARNDPALQAQIGERIQVAHQARVDMVEHFAEAGLLRRDVTPEVLAWGFQTIPVGLRATSPLGIPLDPAVVSNAMEALLTAAAAQA